MNWKYVLGFFFGGAAFIFWIVSALANWTYGLTLGSEETRYMFGSVSLAADIAKAVLIIFIGMALYNKNWAMLAICAVLWLTAATWSVRSATGFISQNFASVTAPKELDSKITHGKINELERSEARLSWLQQQETNVRYGTRTWRRLQTDLKSTQDRIDKLRKDLQKKADSGQVILQADPTNEVIGYFTGWDKKKAQAINFIYFAWLLEIYSLFGLNVLYFMMRDKKHQNEQNEQPEQNEVRRIQGTLTAANLNPKSNKKKQAESVQIEGCEGDNIIPLYTRAKESKENEHERTSPFNHSLKKQMVRDFLRDFAIRPQKGEKLLTKPSEVYQLFCEIYGDVISDGTFYRALKKEAKDMKFIRASSARDGQNAIYYFFGLVQPKLHVSSHG